MSRLGRDVGMSEKWQGVRSGLAAASTQHNWAMHDLQAHPGLPFPCHCRSGRGRVNYDDLSDAEVRELNALARRFLNGQAEVEELPSDTIKSIREMYKQARGEGGLLGRLGQARWAGASQMLGRSVTKQGNAEGPGMARPAASSGKEGCVGRCVCSNCPMSRCNVDSRAKQLSGTSCNPLLPVPPMH